MLAHLHISNYALIRSVDITFAPGFNVITGETGAGKSILLGALSLILGTRADTQRILRPEAKTVVEAQFTFAHPNDALNDMLRQHALDIDEQQCIVRREIAPGGRSRAFINDTPVTLAVMQEVSALLVDIHSQHLTRALATPEYQLSILDAMASNGALRREYDVLWSTLRQAARQLRRERQSMADAAGHEAQLRKELERLDALNPLPEEQPELERELRVLTNAAAHREHLSAMLAMLDGGEAAVMTQLSTMQREAEYLDEVLPPAERIAARLQEIAVEAADMRDTLQHLLGGMRDDPARRAELEQRLDEYYALERKYGLSDGNALCRHRDSLRHTLATLEHADAHLEELRDAVRIAKGHVREKAAELTARRAAAADTLCRQLMEMAPPLAMKHLQVAVAFDPEAELSDTGADSITFLASFNKNQQPVPLDKAASGGELSRLMLCVKAIVAQHMQLPTIIFDEIDTGISGDVAMRTGDMMARMAADLQVIAITHLPQVARRADRHFRVYKTDTAQSTDTCIATLDEAGRVDELATMICGNAADADARRTALSLLS